MTEQDYIEQLEKAADLVDQVQARAAKIEDDARELWLALKDLSYECDGVISTRAPSRKVYNHAYAVLQRMVKYTVNKKPQP